MGELFPCKDFQDNSVLMKKADEIIRMLRWRDIKDIISHKINIGSPYIYYNQCPDGVPDRIDVRTKVEENDVILSFRLYISKAGWIREVKASHACFKGCDLIHPGMCAEEKDFDEALWKDG